VTVRQEHAEGPRIAKLQMPAEQNPIGQSQLSEQFGRWIFSKAVGPFMILLHGLRHTGTCGRAPTLVAAEGPS